MKKYVLLCALLGLGSAVAVPLPVSATTTVIADFVKNVGGNRIVLNTIVPAGADTHSFQPTTGAIRSLSGSKILFANGTGLEPWLPKLKAAAPKVPVSELTAGLKLRPAPKTEDHDEHGEHGHNEHEHDEHDHGAFDPHAWWDPQMAVGYVKNVQAALTKLDPAGKAVYASNAAKYISQIQAAGLDAKKRLARIPLKRRNVVTNHDALHYFAAAFGLKVAGTVLPGLSTEREPSAKEIAQLVQTIRKTGASVIFTENTVNSRLAQTIARETGARIAPPLFTDALGGKGSGGETYLQALKTNVAVVEKALK